MGAIQDIISSHDFGDLHGRAHRRKRMTEQWVMPCANKTGIANDDDDMAVTRDGG